MENEQMKKRPLPSYQTSSNMSNEEKETIKKLANIKIDVALNFLEFLEKNNKLYNLVFEILDINKIVLDNPIKVITVMDEIKYIYKITKDQKNISLFDTEENKYDLEKLYLNSQFYILEILFKIITEKNEYNINSLEKMIELKRNKNSICKCYKCGGTGKIEEYEHIADGYCFQCSGTGKALRYNYESSSNFV